MVGREGREESHTGARATIKAPIITRKVVVVVPIGSPILSKRIL